MNIKKIKAPIGAALSVPVFMDEADIPYETIGTVNWKEYPYRPAVKFRVAYTDNAILLHYLVTEATVRAKYSEDNAAVWTDSCVEFFSIPGADGIYYNLECNCVGTVLLAAGPGRNNREQAPQEVMDKVQRWASLGRQPFDERVGECEWEVALIVPFAAFFKHAIKSLDGQQLKANFYKCGDELQTPHFLSWNPIQIENPDFHRPDFFGTLNFE